MRQCPQTTTSEKKSQTQWNRTSPYLPSQRFATRPNRPTGMFNDEDLEGAVYLPIVSWYELSGYDIWSHTATGTTHGGENK